MRALNRETGFKSQRTFHAFQRDVDVMRLAVRVGNQFRALNTMMGKLWLYRETSGSNMPCCRLVLTALFSLKASRLLAGTLGGSLVTKTALCFPFTAPTALSACKRKEIKTNFI